MPARLAEIEPLFHGLTRAWAQALADYPDDQITMVLDLFQKMRKVVREAATLL